MSTKPEYLQLEPTDDATTVRDRLAQTRGRRVLLIWPAEGTALARKLDLVLVQREAVRRAVRVAIVTHDPQVVQHARELNISTFETIGASERTRWKRGRSNIFVDRDDRPADEPDARELKPVASRLVDEDDAGPRRGRRALRVAVLLVLVVVSLALAVLLVPSATVRVTLAQSRLPLDVTLVADPQASDVDVEAGIVPAAVLRVEMEDSGSVPATGSQAVSDVPATGSVIFINQTARQVEIPADTTVGTSAGTPVLFRTTAAALAPAQIGGQIEVPVEALPGSAGAVGNVESGLINTIMGPLAESLTVRNLSPTTGGESRVVNVVTQDDRDRLLSTLRQQLQARAYVDMQGRAAPNQTIILESIRMGEEREDWQTWSADVGDIADSLSLTMRARVDAMAIDRSLAQQIALARLAAQIPPGRALQPDSITYDCCTVQNVAPDGRITFTLTGEGLASAQVNAGLLQERLAGRTPEDATRYLLSEVDLADGVLPRIELSPDLLGRLPFLARRITVVSEIAPP